MEDRGSYSWSIAYVDSSAMSTLDKDLAKTGVKGIKHLIPTVKVLRKKFKGKAFFDEVPLLFNYGFFKLPTTIIHSKDALMDIKSKVPAIYSWLYTLDCDKKSKGEKVSPRGMVETIKYREIIRLRNIGLLESVYSSNDISNIGPGSYIVLKGYPFDNIPAEVISVNRSKEELKVNLLLESSIREVIVTYSNVFYTVYSEYEEPCTMDNASIESLVERSKFKLDKLYFNEQDEY